MDWLAVVASAWSRTRPWSGTSPSTIIYGDQEDDVAASPLTKLLKRNFGVSLAAMCVTLLAFADWRSKSAWEAVRAPISFIVLI